jgi:hypothetical protein
MDSGMDSGIASNMDFDMFSSQSDRRQIGDHVGKYPRFHFCAKSGHLGAPTKVAPRLPPFRRGLNASNAGL